MTRQAKALGIAVGWLSAYTLLLLSAIVATLAVFWRATLTQAEFHGMHITPPDYPALMNVAAILAIVASGWALVAGLWHPFRRHRFAYVMTLACVANAIVSFLMGNAGTRPFLLGTAGTTLALYVGIAIKRKLAERGN